MTGLEASMQDFGMARPHLNAWVILVHVGVIGYVVVHNHLCQHVPACINSPLIAVTPVLFHQRQLHVLDMQCDCDMHPCHASGMHCTADQPILMAPSLRPAKMCQAANSDAACPSSIIPYC